MIISQASKSLWGGKYWSIQLEMKDDVYKVTIRYTDNRGSGDVTYTGSEKEVPDMLYRGCYQLGSKGYGLTKQVFRDYTKHSLRFLRNEAGDDGLTTTVNKANLKSI